MPPFIIRDGKEISLETNLPVDEFPEELKVRLGDVFADVREFLKHRENFPEVGTLLVDEKGHKAMVREIDIDDFTLLYMIKGFLDPILASGKPSRTVLQLRSVPSPDRAQGPDQWARSEDHDLLRTEHGCNYRILGKFVDYDHD